MQSMKNEDGDNDDLHYSREMELKLAEKLNACKKEYRNRAAESSK